MKKDNLVKLYFPINDGILMLGVESHRDGTPVGWCGKIPFYARYYLTDELGTPLLDPREQSFNTAEEVLFIAPLYKRLLDENHATPNLGFYDIYIRYQQIRARLPEFVMAVCDPANESILPAVKKLLSKT